MEKPKNNFVESNSTEINPIESKSVKSKFVNDDSLKDVSGGWLISVKMGTGIGVQAVVECDNCGHRHTFTKSVEHPVCEKCGAELSASRNRRVYPKKEQTPPAGTI